MADNRMNLICINCPKGCHMTVEKKDDEIFVEGNSCDKGKTYAISEMTNPLRTLTTTIPIKSKEYGRLPVISSAPLPKGKILDVMKQLKSVEAKAPIHINDVIVRDILNLGVDIISSKSIEK